MFVFETEWGATESIMERVGGGHENVSVQTE